MMEYSEKVLQVGNPFLNEVVPETNVTLDLGVEYKDLITTMIDVCTDQRGMGLSANQIGESVRMFVMKNLTTGEWKAYFNPVIVDGNGRHRDKEGCLSFREPTVEYYVRRKMNIRLDYVDIEGEEQTEVFTDLEARCVQHEIDHLNGITMDMVGKK